MVAIHVEGLKLTYEVREKLTLAARDRRLPQTGGTITGNRRRRYVTALDDVSFNLIAGDRLGLVGSNGAGKTTLLKVLYGIYEPTGGRIDITGRVDALFNIDLGCRQEATGRRNIVLRGLINGWDMDQIDASMGDIIEFSELGEFIDLPFKSYSQGMAARLAFAIATTLEPEILLMDEWIGAGDASFQAKAQERMQRLADHAGIIVLASHQNDLVARTCNKVLELEHGRVKRFTTAADYFGSLGT
jgi:ABC-type polysaccharide/polyol phosphate transport system ATPase subunit